MKSTDKEKLIDGWIQLFKDYKKKGRDDSFFWAFEQLESIISQDYDLGWELILGIYQTDDRDEIMENLAAGPLENLIVEHGKKVIDRIETQAALDSKFRLLLGGVWQNVIKDDVWQRIDALVDDRW